MYQNFMTNTRLGYVTGRILGAKDRPTNPEEAVALGRAILCTMPPEQGLEAQCLAAEIGELLDAQRDRYASTLHKVDFPSIKRHVEETTAVVACLLAGFFDTNLHSHFAPDWRDYDDVGVGMTGVGVVTIPAEWEWTGRTFIYD